MSSDSSRNNERTPLTGYTSYQSEVGTNARNRTLENWSYRKCCAGLCGALFTVCVAGAIGAPILIGHVVEEKLSDTTVVDSNTSSGFAQFANWWDSATNYYKIYVFNITNPDGILIGEKPVVEELGPFVYDNNQIRDDIRWSDDGNEMSFRQKTNYYFNKEMTMRMSNGEFDSDDIAVTTMNFMFYGAKAILGLNASTKVVIPCSEEVLDICGPKKPLENVMNISWKQFPGTEKERMFTLKTVRQIAVGYVATAPPPRNNTDELPIPPTPVPGIVGNLSNTQDIDYLTRSAFKTGKSDIADVRQYTEWRNYSTNMQICPFQNNSMTVDGVHDQIRAKVEQMKLPETMKKLAIDLLLRVTRDTVTVETFNCAREEWAQWPCCGNPKPAGPWQDKIPHGYNGTVKLPPPNGLMGTDGSQFKPNLKSDELVYVFVDALFRSIPFQYEAQQTYEGVKLRRYVIPASLLGSQKTFPPNGAFYMFGPDGIMNMSMVENGLPIFISQPHFYQAGKAGTVDKVVGLDPDKSKHQTFILVDPQSGATLVEHKRVMVSLQIKPEPAIDAFREVKEAYVPVAWFDEVGLADKKAMDQIKQLKLAGKIQKLALDVLGPVAAVALVGTLVLLFPGRFSC